MSSEFEDNDHTAFTGQLRGNHAPEDRGSGDASVEVNISRSAWRLHHFAIVTSLCEGTFGFITDDYLNHLRAEGDLATLELVSNGLWERVPGGYVIHDRETMQLALLANDWVNQEHSERD